MFEEIIEAIPTDFNAGAKYICGEFFKFEFTIPNGHKGNRHEEYVEFYFLLEAYLKNNHHKFESVELGTDKNQNINRISNFFIYINEEFSNRLTSNSIEEAKAKYDNLFKNSFSFEFSKGDLEKVQSLVNELRDIISKSELFTAEHKQRILKRLEKLQGELHKNVSDLDRFWGLIGDAGVVLGKFGQDAKPIVDRIRELVDIVWRTQARAEELPSGTTIPMLNDGKSTEQK